MSRAKRMPYIAVGNNELAAARDIDSTVRCRRCGQTHAIETSLTTRSDGTPGTRLHFYRCAGNTFLCGVEGKEWSPSP